MYMRKIPWLPRVSSNRIRSCYMTSSNYVPHARTRPTQVLLVKSGMKSDLDSDMR